MRGATRRSLRIFSTEQISIHAPHARSDSSVSSRRQPTRHFNPRSSCEERPVRGLESALGTLFQSTLLMRGATRRGGHGADARADFNPRSSCEERLDCGIHAAGPPNFNPRSSCEERRAGEAGQLSRILFQSTLLMRGATSAPSHYGRAQPFQSTLLMRGATQFRVIPEDARLISIHAPHARSDLRTHE